MTPSLSGGDPVVDFVVLKNLRLMVVCGALPEEKERAQPFEFNIEVETDLAAAGVTDDLDDTINYGLLTDSVVAAITTQEFTLLERMAQVVADVVLADLRAIAVSVEVVKLRPPVAHPLEASAVRIHRRQAGNVTRRPTGKQ